MRPLVSIVMPMKNAEAYVEASLHSILSQDYTVLEIIVIDDGSTDDSRSLVSSINDNRIKIVDGPRAGISAALNLGVQKCSGEVIMRCDSDDLFEPGRLSFQVDWLSKNHEFGAVCGSYVTVDRGDKLVSSLNTGQDACDITSELRKGVVRTHLGTFAIRKQCLLGAGMFRAFFKTGEDVDMQLRLSEVCKIWYEPIKAYRYRLHHSSITHSSGRNSALFYDEMARIFQRERLQSGMDSLQRGVEIPVSFHSQVKGTSIGRHLQGQMMGEAWRLHASGAKREGIIMGGRALSRSILNLEAWRSFIFLCLKK